MLIKTYLLKDGHDFFKDLYINIMGGHGVLIYDHISPSVLKESEVWILTCNKTKRQPILFCSTLDISELNYPGFSEYLLLENRRCILKEFYSYNILEGEKIDMTAENGYLEVEYLRSVVFMSFDATRCCTTLYNKGEKVTEYGIDWADRKSCLEVEFLTKHRK